MIVVCAKCVSVSLDFLTAFQTPLAVVVTIAFKLVTGHAPYQTKSVNGHLVHQLHQAEGKSPEAIQALVRGLVGFVYTFIDVALGEGTTSSTRRRLKLVTRRSQYRL
jgi:hypothetical protein